MISVSKSAGRCAPVPPARCSACRAARTRHLVAPAGVGELGQLGPAYRAAFGHLRPPLFSPVQTLLGPLLLDGRPFQAPAQGSGQPGEQWRQRPAGP